MTMDRNAGEAAPLVLHVIHQLAHILGDYVRDPRMRSVHAAAARGAAVERFSLDTMVAQYRAIYEARLSHERCRA
jgi:hypothetical protein